MIRAESITDITVADLRQPGPPPGECQIVVDDLGFCGSPATCRITSGCVHEHLMRNDACNWHRELFLATFDTADVFCGHCQDADPDHRCTVRVFKVEEL